MASVLQAIQLSWHPALLDFLLNSFLYAVVIAAFTFIIWALIQIEGPRRDFNQPQIAAVLIIYFCLMVVVGNLADWLVIDIRSIHCLNSWTPSNSMGPNSDPEFITKFVPYVTLFNRFYTYFVLYRLYSSIEQNHKLSWPVLLYIVFSFAVPCGLDYFQLISDA